MWKSWPLAKLISIGSSPPNGACPTRAIRAMGPVRRRNGADSWRVFRDLAEEGLFVERYILGSWAEYVRLRSRMTMGDRQLIEDVGRFQRADTPIRVSRFLGVDLPESLVAMPEKTAAAE